MKKEKENLNNKKTKKLSKKMKKRIFLITLSVVLIILVAISIKIVMEITKPTENIYEENIPEKAELNEVESGIRALEGFSDFTVRGSHGIIYVVINLSEDLEDGVIDTHFNTFLNNLVEDIQSEYDIQIMIDGEYDDLPIIAYKHKSSFSFAVTRGEIEDES